MTATNDPDPRGLKPFPSEKDVKKSFGAALRSFRRLSGISQEELGDLAGLHRTYICDIERGSRNVSLENIERLALALKISISTLFSNQDAGRNGVGTHRHPGH
jgi:transcriptional regulator with XRE-family HTH domain